VSPRTVAAAVVLGRLGPTLVFASTPRLRCSITRSRSDPGAMQTHDMIDGLLARIAALDPDAEYRALLAHVSVTSPTALEWLAYEHRSATTREAQRIAAVQLRVVQELPGKLRWLEGVCLDPGVDPGTRVALTAVLRSLADEAELGPVIDSSAAVLLEPALLFHVLIDRLRPWLPTSILALEPDAVLELLQLGIPDYLHPLVRDRFNAIWTRFHQLRQLPQSRLGVISDPPRLDADRLQRLLDDVGQRPLVYPPPPPWLTLSWFSPWSAEAVPHPVRRPRAS
jgi:hypothetical protein